MVGWAVLGGGGPGPPKRNLRVGGPRPPKSAVVDEGGSCGPLDSEHGLGKSRFHAARAPETAADE